MINLTVTNLLAYMDNLILKRDNPNHKQVTGTYLWMLSWAKRLSASDRHRRARFLCALCGSIKVIRVSDVKPGVTVSCGCHGRELYIRHWEAAAARLTKGAKNLIFEMKTAQPHWTRRRDGRLTNYGIAKKLDMPKCLVDFSLRATFSRLQELVSSGANAADVTLSQWMWVMRMRSMRIRLSESVRSVVESFWSVLSLSHVDDSIECVIRE
jgi:hypothetical protein